MASRLNCTGRRNARSILFLFILIALVAIAACSKDPSNPDPVPIEGRWEGYVGWGTPPYTFTGDLVLLIDESRECSVDGVMSGTLLGWGEFELRFTGTIYINVTNGVLGEITITRYRAGIDTVQVTGSMAGQFDLKQVYAFGSWETYPDEAFDIEGEWGAMKQDEEPLIRY